MASEYAYILENADAKSKFQHLILTNEEEDRIAEEFDARIPMCGEASTPENEFFRISERVRYEIFNNGGGNDMTKECDFLKDQMMEKNIPKEMFSHVYNLISFLRMCYHNDFARDSNDEYEYEWEKAMAFSCELSKYALSKLV
jgi:hypothetical protein